MVYVTSDLHGFSLERFQAFLGQVGFSDEDYLFILGDVIDRGEDGVAILKWLLVQPNVELILGNHEAMPLACEFLFREVDNDSLDSLSAAQIHIGIKISRNEEALLVLVLPLRKQKSNYYVTITRGGKRDYLDPH
jgi:hypothetical protein